MENAIFRARKFCEGGSNWGVLGVYGAFSGIPKIPIYPHERYHLAFGYARRIPCAAHRATISSGQIEDCTSPM